MVFRIYTSTYMTSSLASFAGFVCTDNRVNDDDGIHHRGRRDERGHDERRSRSGSNDADNEDSSAAADAREAKTTPLHQRTSASSSSRSVNKVLSRHPTRVRSISSSDDRAARADGHETPNEGRRRATRKRRKPRGPKKTRVVEPIVEDATQGPLGRVRVHCAYGCGRTYVTVPCERNREEWHRTLRKLNAHESQRCRMNPAIVHASSSRGRRRRRRPATLHMPNDSPDNVVSFPPGPPVPPVAVSSEVETSIARRDTTTPTRTSPANATTTTNDDAIDAEPTTTNTKRGSKNAIACGTILAELKRHRNSDEDVLRLRHQRRRSSTTDSGSDGVENDAAIAHALMTLKDRLTLTAPPPARPRTSSAAPSVVVANDDGHHHSIGATLATWRGRSRRVSGVKRTALAVTGTLPPSPRPTERRRSANAPSES